MIIAVRMWKKKLFEQEKVGQGRRRGQLTMGPFIVLAGLANIGLGVVGGGPPPPPPPPPTWTHIISIISSFLHKRTTVLI